MAQLNRNECSVLPLVLHGKWFNMIASGRKREEYRTSKKVISQIERWVGHSTIRGKHLVVEFFLGYQKDRPKMAFLARIPGIRDYAEHPDWGEPEGEHYVIPIMGKEIRLC